jgi:hypothetical protein
VAVKCDIFFHARLLSFSKRDFHRQPTLTAGVALSYFHSERSEESLLKAAVILAAGFPAWRSRPSEGKWCAGKIRRIARIDNISRGFILRSPPQASGEESLLAMALFHHPGRAEPCATAA